MSAGTADTVVCVTGGSGYIGSWLVRKLLGRGCVVHATLRSLGTHTTEQNPRRPIADLFSRES